MPSFQTSRRVQHAPEKMFDLVADVEKYPEFVPLCQSLVVRSHETRPDGTEVLLADMTVAYKLIRETFTSRVTLDRARREILVEYVNGPFSYLENRWRFEPAEGGASKVSFYLSYEFRSRTLSLVMGTLFDAAFRRFAEAFERRADEVYGRRLQSVPAS
jgi:coenzyme Q-binding protein COQ10